MPHLPKGMIDTIEKLLSFKFFEAEVKSAVYINPEILQVSFAADLHNIDFYIGSAVMVRTGSKDLRHYTISAFNRDTGLFEILFHIHGNGPGSDLAARLEIGEKLKLAVPGGKKMFVPESNHHFLFGDETSLSLIQIFIAEIQKTGALHDGVIELNAQNLEVPEKLDINLQSVLRTPKTPAAQAIAYLMELKTETDFPLEQCAFYLTGNVASVHAFRKEIKKLGVSSKNIKFQGYWAEGSIGL